MKKVVTFGEIMQRLCPEGYNRFLQADRFTVTYAGGEANVAASLANFGENASFVSKIPAHEIGQSAVNSLRKLGVCTEQIIRGGDVLGVYYVEKGASQRPSKVIYNRANSAIAKAHREDFDWNKILENGYWFHFTGITPALGGELPEICEDALKVCREKDIIVSCDLNYRKNLWAKETARKIMSRLMAYVDICIANEEDAEDVFGIRARNTDITQGMIDTRSYEDVAKQLAGQFALKKVAITLRSSVTASDNYWSAMLYDGNHCYYSKKYAIHIVDRVGGGDSFGAGLIYALLHDFDPQDAIEFATAASCLKHTIEGDYNLVTVDEVLRLAHGDGSGRVQR